MTLLLIFVSAAFAITALYFALAPFLASREEQARAELIDEELKKVEQLVASKSMLLQSLREIEFEYETAKMSDEDYERFRTSLERQAIGVMRELDRIHGGRGWEEKIDAELSARLAERGLDAPMLNAASENPEDVEASEQDSDVLVEAAVAEPDAPDESPNVWETESHEDALECSACDAELAPDDRFCSKCGEPTNFDRSTAEAAG